MEEKRLPCLYYSINGDQILINRFVYDELQHFGNGSFRCVYMLTSNTCEVQEITIWAAHVRARACVK